MSKKAVEKEIGAFKTGAKTRVMVFGTFDGLHPGHLHFFRQAKSLDKKTFLIVSVARDRNVERIKGQKPRTSEKRRLALVRRTGLADQVVLSGLRDHLPHILRARPHIIALGYDQKNYIQNLKQELKMKGLQVKIIRLRPYKAHIYKNALLRPRQ